MYLAIRIQNRKTRKEKGVKIGVDNEMRIDGEVISVQIKVMGSVLRY